jgi:hypothetical protein
VHRLRERACHPRGSIVGRLEIAEGIHRPPRYYDLRALRETIGRLEALRPELLLTAHYAVLERDDALDWLATGRAFVDDVERLVHGAIAGGTTDLWQLTQLVDAELGPFPEFMTELGATVLAACG